MRGGEKMCIKVENVHIKNKLTLEEQKICPRCKNNIVGYPSLSRKGNKTEICSECGTLEALEEFILYQKTNKVKL